MDRRQFLISKPDRVQRLERVQVLIVHSSEKAAGLIKNIFHQIGFAHVVTAATAADAIFTMKQMRIDMLMVDSQLREEGDEESLQPEWESVSGIEFVRKLRHSVDSPNRFAPTVLLAEGLTQQDILQARDAGVNEIVMKPIGAQDFCMRLTQLFDKPRNFITAPTYKGPCRRRKSSPPEGVEDRRVWEVRLIRCDEMRSVQWELNG